MSVDPASWLSLLAVTVEQRLYVFVFLTVFLFLAGRDLGWRHAAGWLAWGFAVAFSAEYASTRVGIPFGLYHYTGTTAGRELFISNVPFFDPLSFPFLAYASYCLARWALARAEGWAPLALAGVLMMLLDVVIDPLAVRGERWFLGHVFYYAEAGAYFGVPFSNFVGWALVGSAIVGGYLWVARRRTRPPRSPVGGIGLYYGVLCFMLAMTGRIEEWRLLGAGILVHVAVILVLYRLRALSTARGWEALHRGAAGRAATAATDKRGV
ncbi:MAG TPA: carotenoid biosynthesis protein [Methylomirabilota bacterium]|nr:carotenoid biosynthesis protein [Methylomirabilota bacterium]